MQVEEYTHLAGYGDLFTVFETNGTLFAVGVVENDRDACFCDTRLSAFVDEVLLILCAHLEEEHALTDHVLIVNTDLLT